MNKFIIFATLIAYVAAANCSNYYETNGCGNGAGTCVNYFRYGRDCIDCSSNDSFQGCGGSKGSAVCSSYRKSSNSETSYCINCSSYINGVCGGEVSTCSGWEPNSIGTLCINCENPKVDETCKPECTGYMYDSETSKCTLNSNSNSSGKVITIATALLLLTFIF